MQNPFACIPLGHARNQLPVRCCWAPIYWRPDTYPLQCCELRWRISCDAVLGVIFGSILGVEKDPIFGPFFGLFFRGSKTLKNSVLLIFIIIELFLYIIIEVITLINSKLSKRQKRQKRQKRRFWQNWRNRFKKGKSCRKVGPSKINYPLGLPVLTSCT